jgi:polyferredoxin
MKNRQKIRKGILLFMFFLFPALFYYFSPVIIIQSTVKGIINGSFVMFVVLFISGLVLGRAWCGWACGAGGCQEAIFLARDKKIRKGNFIKWILWVPWVSAIVILAIRAGGYTKIDFLYETTHGLSIGNLSALIAYLVVLLVLIALPAYIFGRRSFCHHICWMAPFLIIGRKVRNIFNWPSLKLIAEPSVCKSCHLCDKHCPMSLPVEDMVKSNKMENAECILCGTCVDACPAKAIKYTFAGG